ncbi:hypothetical protein KAM622c_58040 (plasmid) [Klebsiella quasipneumoniae subsp. quasipneumoniae]|nr:hypothetical protein KAM622c_58040 [Klebsiella quasipneumoniae subsp. quasipneumoniae]
MLLQFYTFISNPRTGTQMCSQLITTKVNIHHHNCYYNTKHSQNTETNNIPSN